MSCENCNSKNLVVNNITHEVVCGECGVVQIEQTFQNIGQVQVIEERKKNTDKNIKLNNLLKKEQLFSVGPEITRQATIIKILNTTLDKGGFIMNEEVKKRVLEINEIIRSIPENSKRTHKVTLVIAICFFYAKNKYMSLSEIFKRLKITRQRAYLKVFHTARQKVEYNRLQASALKNIIVTKLLENKEFNDRIIFNNLTRSKVISMINTKFDTEINKYQTELKDKRSTVAKVIYNILINYDRTLITQKILCDVAKISEAAIRNKRIH